MRRRKRSVGRPPLGSLPPESDLAELLSFWNRATASRNGIAVASKNPVGLANKLLMARRTCGHPSHMLYKIVVMPDEVRIIPHASS